MPVKINSRQELYDYLNTFDFNTIRDGHMSSIYFLVKYDSNVWPMHFMQFKDAWFESPCTLEKFQLNDDALEAFVTATYVDDAFDDAYEFEKKMQKDGWHYSIENFQCSPFLPEKIKILDVFSDEKCLEWLLEHTKA